MAKTWDEMGKRERKVYTSAMTALYGDGVPEVVQVDSNKESDRKRNDCPLESDEQIRLVTWLRKRDILFYAIPMGGSRNKREAQNLKRQGSVAGVPDLCLPIAAGGYHGLYIEMKRQKNSYPTEQQQFWLEQLNRNGYLAEVARGCDAAKKIICDYLGIAE